MFGNLGYAEVIIICFLALLLFGAKRLPEIGSSLGKSIRSFKSSLKEIQEDLPKAEEMREEQRRSRPAPSSNYSQSQNPSPPADQEQRQD